MCLILFPGDVPSFFYPPILFKSLVYLGEVHFSKWCINCTKDEFSSYYDPDTTRLFMKQCLPISWAADFLRLNSDVTLGQYLGFSLFHCHLLLFSPCVLSYGLAML